METLTKKETIEIEGGTDEEDALAGAAVALGVGATLATGGLAALGLAGAGLALSLWRWAYMM